MENISVVIANYKYFDLTEKTVRSIRENYKDIEIHVVDDGSPNFEENKEVLTKHSVNLIKKNHLGHGNSIDYGIGVAKTKYVITLDHDVVLLKKGAIEYLYSFIDNETVAVGPRRDNHNRIPYVDCCFAIWDTEFIKDRFLSFNHVIISGTEYSTGQILSHQIRQFGGKTMFVGSSGFYEHNRDNSRYKLSDYKYDN